jgi:hypothetical protein
MRRLYTARDLERPSCSDIWPVRESENLRYFLRRRD